LEPHRFEDLIRQLIYDFRTWRTLEATGRTGSDDGFDARAWEAVSSQAVDDEDDNDTESGGTDRQWLVQCKRERTITPKKLDQVATFMKRSLRVGCNSCIPERQNS
jgi:hypothetical protein